MPLSARSRPCAARCAALREQVVAEVDAGRLQGVAQAMQVAVEIQRTDDGPSGLLKGVIPHQLDSLAGKCLTTAQTLA